MGSELKSILSIPLIPSKNRVSLNSIQKSPRREGAKNGEFAQFAQAHPGFEDPEIFPFLGSSRLEEPINRFRANAVFHGHAHNGTSDGVTATGIPVYNVSAPLLRKTGKLYRIVEF